MTKPKRYYSHKTLKVLFALSGNQCAHPDGSNALIEPATIRHAIETKLQSEPNLETRNRKPLKRPVELGADWEIRFGPGNRFRVFYSVEQENRQVFIVAIGIKKGNRLIIGREEVSL